MAPKSLLLGIFLLSINGPLQIFAAEKEIKMPKYDPKIYKNRAAIAKLRLEKETRKRTYDRLQKAKIDILGGALESAQELLNRVEDKNSRIKYIRYRYQALIYFILEKYELSLKLLNKKGFESFNNYPDICTLKILNLLALNKADKIMREHEECQKVTETFSKSDQLWINALLDIKLKRFSGGAKTLIDGPQYLGRSNDIIRVWLKVATYLNQEKTIERYLDFLHLEALKSPQIREIVGLIYYRLGKKKLALTYIQDLTTPNAENIKGNILLGLKKYKKAYKYFKRALKRKKNSFNALERTLPLAWHLGRWKEGIDFLYDYIDKSTDSNKLLTLHAAFNIRNKKFKKARFQLHQLNKSMQYQTPLNVDVLNSFNAILNHKSNQLEYYLTRACHKNEAINCWLLMQTLVWGDLSQTINRKDKLFPEKWQQSFLTLSQKYSAGKIDEEILIDQKDIEELDDDLVTIDITAE